MRDDQTTIETPLPNWPILLTTALAARYLSLDEHSFGIVAQKAGVQPVDMGLPLVRWRRTELDRLVGRLSNAAPAEAAAHAAPDPEQAEVMVQRIIQGLAARLAAQPQPTSPPAHALSIKDAGKLIGISRSTLYKLIADGRLPTMRIGSRTLVKRADLEALLDAPPPAATTGRRGRPRRL